MEKTQNLCELKKCVSDFKILFQAGDINILSFLVSFL